MPISEVRHLSKISIDRKLTCEPVIRQIKMMMILNVDIYVIMCFE